MATKAKLEGNARYLAKMKTISLRMPPELHEKISQAAQLSTNGSVQGYILHAVREQLSADAAGENLVRISKEDAEAYAKANNQTLEEWLSDHQATQE